MVAMPKKTVSIYHKIARQRHNSVHIFIWILERLMSWFICSLTMYSMFRPQLRVQIINVSLPLHISIKYYRPHTLGHKSEALGFETLSLTAEAGLSVLHDLVMHSPSTPNGFGLSNTELVNIVVFTNCHDPWTTDKAACDASRILALLLPGDKMSDFLVGNILQGLLRPIFSNSSSTVPASLRLSHPQDSRSARQGVVEHLAWKHPNPQTVSIFRWAVQMANVGSFTDILSNYEDVPLNPFHILGIRGGC